jgi:PAS domain S-box-containing protein
MKASREKVMPFFGTFANYPILERLRSIRQFPDIGYGIGTILFVFAMFSRWILGEYIGAQLPFITFYPAIIIATVLGGLGPGVLVTILSVLTAWYLFLPPEYSFELGRREFVQLLLFVFVCSINLGAITILNVLVDRLIAQEKNTRLLLESASVGIIVVDEQNNIKFVNASIEQLFGYERLELLERNVEMILVPGQLAYMYKAERDTFPQKSEGRPMGAGRGRRKNGSEFPVEIGLNPVSDNGKGAILATIIDVSQRKGAQQPAAALALRT